MENQSRKLSRKLFGAVPERKDEAIDTGRVQRDHEERIWHMAEGQKLPSDHPSQGPFPTD